MKEGKLFAGIMFSKKEAYQEALRRLLQKFGEIDAESEAYEFDFTDYYAEEMGRPLWKKFIVFREYVERDRLAEIKLFTNSVEKELSANNKRRVNIDPGYITPANLILATTKEFPHRIYLKDGIFAEVTLAFKKNGCSFFEWTYPDFRTTLVCKFFSNVRKTMK